MAVSHLSTFLAFEFCNNDASSKEYNIQGGRYKFKHVLSK